MRGLSIIVRGVVGAAAALAVGAGAAWAGGSPENVLLIVNPANAQSMYIGNYYKNARNIPDSNVLYMNPFASDYTGFIGANGNQQGVIGKVRSSRLDRQIDYVVVCDGSAFSVNAAGIASDTCSPITRMGISSAYTFSFINSRVTTSGLFITSSQAGISTNMQARYVSAQTSPLSVVPFTAAVRFLNGAVSQGATAERYFMGAQLAYTGSNGNSLSEVLSFIDRSVSADGTRPANGKVYYVDNTNDPARNVRVSAYPSNVAALPAGVGQILSVADTASTALPVGRFDAIGVMTGAALPNIDGENFGLLPGAFCDHLTSFAATFDDFSQTKMTRWIAKGASGTSGAVEEPCNYPVKFVGPIVHTYINRGMSLGEAFLRSHVLLPFQTLFLGDPITRPYGNFPTVSGNVPGGTLSGVVSFTPTAAAGVGAIGSVDLYVNGVKFSSAGAGQPLSLNTATLPDGWNEVRVLATDNTAVANVGRWIGAIDVNNFGRAATVSLSTTSGDLGTSFSANYSAGGGAVSEVRLIQNGRVLTAASGGGAGSVTGSLSVFGRQLGAGVSRVQIEAIFTDGRVVRTAPVPVNVSFTGGTGTSVPTAPTYTLRVPRGGPIVVDLPGVYQDVFSQVNWSVITAPNHASIGSASAGPGRRGSVVITANQNASGTDTLRYEVSTPSGVATGTVRIEYVPEIRTQFGY